MGLYDEENGAGFTVYLKSEDLSLLEPLFKEMKSCIPQNLNRTVATCIDMLIKSKSKSDMQKVTALLLAFLKTT